MLLRKIEALRKEPKAVRNRYAFGVALSVTLLIGVVWGVALPARFTNTFVVSEETKAEREEFAGQLIELRDLVTDSVSEIKTQAELVGATVNSTTTAELVSSFASNTLQLGTSSVDLLATTSRSIVTSTTTIAQ